MINFLDTITEFTPLTEEAKEALTSILKIKKVEKGQTLLKENSICKYIYFVSEGLTRTYYYKDGKDVTDWLSIEGQFACSIVSFITQEPDRRGIETLENSTLFSFHVDELERLYSKFHDIERLGRHIVSLGLVQLQQRFDDLHFATAIERYRKIMTKNPTLIQRVPLGVLASFLGISQETLSRIRGKI